MAGFLKHKGFSFVEVLLAAAFLVASVAAAMSLLAKQQHLLKKVEQLESEFSKKYNQDMLAPQKNGYSLIELLVTLSICALLTAAVLPTFEQHQRVKKRQSAQAALLNYMVELESNLVGLDDLKEGVAIDGYEVSVKKTGINGYRLDATATGSQTKDVGCTQLTLTHQLQRSPRQCWP